MAAVVNIDNVEGAAGSHKLIEGWAITRTALVTGLSGATSTGNMLQTAEAAVIAVTGDRGSACPGITAPTYLDDFVPELVNADCVRFRIIYKGFRRAMYEFDGSMTQVQSNLDVNGNVIKVQYKYPTDYKLDPTKKAGQVITQGGMINKQIPTAQVNVRFQVSDGFIINGVAVTATKAASWFASFQGAINDDEYTLGIITGDPHTWLVSRVRATTSCGDSTYDVSMTFSYKADTWDPQVTFINPDDGLPPADILGPTDSLPSGQTEPGYKRAREYVEASLPVVVFGNN